LKSDTFAHSISLTEALTALEDGFVVHKKLARQRRGFSFF